MTTKSESGKVRDAKAYEAFVSEIRTFIPSERIYTDELRRLGWGTDAGDFFVPAERLFPSASLLLSGVTVSRSCHGWYRSVNVTICLSLFVLQEHRCQDKVSVTLS